jgi:HAMP domain-containing protein
VLVALGIGFFVSRSILRTVHQVGSAAGKLALGELDQEPDLRSHDELGQMADAFRNMVAYQKAMATVATAIAEGNLGMDMPDLDGIQAAATATPRSCASW